MKKCSKCKVVKELVEFNKSKKMSIGVRSECRTCQAKIHKAWRVRNPDKERASKKRRTHRIRKAVPAWGTTEWERFSLEELYALRRLRSALTGVEHHVDHVVPLRGTHVSGLHVSENLKVILAHENQLKSNQYAIG